MTEQTQSLDVQQEHQKFIEDLGDWTRSHTCGQLTLDNDGQTVCLMGWVQYRRDHGGLIFVDLRDREGLTQVVFSPDIAPAAHENAHILRSEYVLAIKGVVEKLLATAGVTGYTVRRNAQGAAYHPGRAADLYLGETKLATLGEVHPAVCANYGVKARIVAADVNLDAVFAAQPRSGPGGRRRPSRGRAGRLHPQGRGQNSRKPLPVRCVHRRQDRPRQKEPGLQPGVPRRRPHPHRR